VEGILFDKVGLGVYMVVGDGYVYKMGKKLEVVSSGVEMGSDRW